MSSTHLVYTDKADGGRVALPKAVAHIQEVIGEVQVYNYTYGVAATPVVTKETFDELIKQLEE